MTRQPRQSSSLQLGIISDVDPRQVWPREERDFTPWLADHIEQLSKVLGIELDVLQTEKKVGNYELDIYAVDKDSNGTDIVIIENQLDQTDHKHLGQLIAYAAGTQPKVIVWISPLIREEHISAFEWLNRVTDDSIEFYLVRMQVIQIDTSLPAVRFEIEVAPSDFARSFQQVIPKSPTVNPTHIIWSDQPSHSMPVVSWRDVFRKVLERAATEGFDFRQSVPKSTIDPGEAQGYNAKAMIALNGQSVFVEINYSAKAIVRYVRTLLNDMKKPSSFLTIERDNSTTLELP